MNQEIMGCHFQLETNKIPAMTSFSMKNKIVKHSMMKLNKFALVKNSSCD